MKASAEITARPALASERLELLADGRVRYRFKRVSATPHLLPLAPVEGEHE